MKKFILAIALLTLITAACKKTTDNDGPVITITSPTSGQMFSNGDSAQVTFTVTDADLHEFGYAIINVTSGDTLYEGEEHTHGDVSFNEKFKLPGTATPLRLDVDAEDHNSNSNSKSVSFHTM